MNPMKESWTLFFFPKQLDKGKTIPSTTLFSKPASQEHRIPNEQASASCTNGSVQPWPCSIPAMHQHIPKMIPNNKASSPKGLTNFTPFKVDHE